MMISKAAIAFILINLQTIAIMLISKNTGHEFGAMFFVGCVVSDFLYFMISDLSGDKK